MFSSEHLRQNEAAHQFTQQGKYKEALEIYQRLSNIYPQNGFILFNTAQIYLHLNQSTNAVEAFEKAIPLLPKESLYDLHKNFVISLLEKKFYFEAFRFYLPVLNHPENEEDLLLGLKIVLLHQDIDRSEQYLIKNVQKYPDILNKLIVDAEIPIEITNRLKNRKRGIIEMMQQDYQGEIEKVQNQLDFLTKHKLEELILEQLENEWAAAIENFDYANEIQEVVDSREQLADMSKQIGEEVRLMKLRLEKEKLNLLRKQYRNQVKTLNENELSLVAALKHLPGVSLKDDVAVFLKRFRIFKEQIRQEKVKVVELAYQDTTILLERSEALKQDCEKAIETAVQQHLQAKEIEQAKVMNRALAKHNPTNVVVRQNEEVIVEVLESRLKKQRRKGLLLALRILGIVVVLFLLYWLVSRINFSQLSFGSFGASDKQVLLTGVFLRATPTSNAAKLNETSYPEGTTLEITGYPNRQWYKLHTSDGLEGYMKREYMVSVMDYAFLNSLYGQTDVKNWLPAARHKLAILNYFKEKKWKGNTSTELERKVYGKIDYEREKWLLSQLPSDDLDKKIMILDLTDKKRLDLVCLVGSSTQERLLVFTFEPDNTSQLLYQDTLEGTKFELQKLEESGYNKLEIKGDMYNMFYTYKNNKIEKEYRPQ